MGKVIDGTYDFSLARWFYTVERQKILDFVPIGKDKSVLALHQDSLTFSMKMLIKPFQNNVWTIILCSVAIVFILIGILMKFKKNASSMKILKITISISFVMIHAYYTGAMAMFLTSKPSVGFTTLKDVLKAVPEWTLVYLQGMEVQFQEPVSKEEVDFVKYWKIAQNDLEKYSKATTKEAFEALFEDKTALFALYEFVRQVYNSNTGRYKPIIVFGEGGYVNQALIFPKNSPLTPILKKAAARSMESGELEKFIENWTGPKLRDRSDPEMKVLDIEQVILVVVLLFGAIVASFFCFVMEKITHALFKSRFLHSFSRL